MIDDFSFALNQSDKVAIIGEEGNGKSTLLKLLYSEETVGNYVHHTGEIIRDGMADLKLYFSNPSGYTIESKSSLS